MPKVIDTRRQRAQALLDRILRGPSFSGPLRSGEVYGPEEYSRQYRLWMNSWIKNQLIDLVPELRAAAKAAKAAEE